jgi:hypothetical protein
MLVPADMARGRKREATVNLYQNYFLVDYLSSSVYLVNPEVPLTEGSSSKETA